MNRLTVPFLVLCIMLTGCSFSISVDSLNCALTAERNAVFASEGIKTIRIEAAAGYLEIEGKPDLQEVRVDGIACASQSEALDRIQLRTDQHGEELRIVAEIPSGFNLGQKRLDLNITVPDTVALKVNDSSGSTRIRSVGALDLKKNSGSTNIDGVKGPLRSETSSGSFHLRNVEGDVRLRSDSGSATIEAVRGQVLVEEKSSGSLRIAEIQGDVIIERMSSGSLTVHDVQGDLTVKRKSSGSFRYDNISGRVSGPAN